MQPAVDSLAHQSRPGGTIPARIRQLAYYGIPMLFCAAVHWIGLHTWFTNDDFAWLGLRLKVDSARSLIHMLFTPAAGGTVRVLSERAYFLAFSSLFGLHSAPFHWCALLTQCANIVLLMQIAKRVTGSAGAGFAAAILWVANAGLAEPMAWASAYNEIAEAFCLLLAFRLFLAYIDTGRLRYWIWQWVVFLLGFGVLELNIVYPALAFGYALVRARDHLRKTLYLFIPSVLFFVIDILFIPKRQTPAYRMYFDASVGHTLWRYWTFTFGAIRGLKIDWRPLWLGSAISAAATIGLAVFIYRKTRNRDWLPIFFIAWYLAVLLPVLPLRNHFTEYYVMLPSLGLAILTGWAIASCKRPLTLGAAVALACLYLAASITDIRSEGTFLYVRAQGMKAMMLGLEAQQKVHPRQTIFLTGVDNVTFWTGFCDGPFWLVGISHAYILPDDPNTIESRPGVACDSSISFATPDDRAHLLRSSGTAVFAFDGRTVRDVTATYLANLHAEFLKEYPGYVDVSDQAFAESLGPTWYPVESNYRWMPKTATVKMHGPTQPGQVLHAAGYCPDVLLAHGPLSVTFRVNGAAIGSATVNQPNQLFDLQIPLPAALVGRGIMELKIEVNRTYKPSNENRELGLIFTTFTIK